MREPYLVSFPWYRQTPYPNTSISPRKSMSINLVILGISENLAILEMRIYKLTLLFMYVFMFRLSTYMLFLFVIDFIFTGVSAIAGTLILGFIRYVYNRQRTMSRQVCGRFIFLPRWLHRYTSLCVQWGLSCSLPLRWDISQPPQHMLPEQPRFYSCKYSYFEGYVQEISANNNLSPWQFNIFYNVLLVVDAVCCNSSTCFFAWVVSIISR